MNRLVRVGAEALKPQKTGMKWLSPYVSRRKANVLRKRALRDGSYGSVVQDPGEQLWCQNSIYYLDKLHEVQLLAPDVFTSISP